MMDNDFDNASPKSPRRRMAIYISDAKFSDSKKVKKSGNTACNPLDVDYHNAEKRYLSINSIYSKAVETMGGRVHIEDYVKFSKVLENFREFS